MTHETPPCEVTLVYRHVGAGHVFTAEGMPGFYIGSSSLKKAFEMAMVGLGAHAYETETSFDEFEASIGSESLLANFLCARRNVGGATSVHS